MKSNLFRFIEAQTHCSTSWHSNTSLTLNELIKNIICSNLYTTSKHAPEGYKQNNELPIKTDAELENNSILIFLCTTQIAFVTSYWWMDSKYYCFYECRCSQEIHDALQMAMTGHARLLDNYAELQEKHIIQLGKMREIREGVLDIKKVAKRSGLNNVEERWFDVQATQIVYMKVEQDRYREEIQGLQAQLQDTADAVQAAGELLVRLKEAEQAAIIAKVI